LNTATPTTHIYTLSLHDALPIYTDFMTSFADWLTVQNGNLTTQRVQRDPQPRYLRNGRDLSAYTRVDVLFQAYFTTLLVFNTIRSEEHTSELQSRGHLVCRLLLE